MKNKKLFLVRYISIVLITILIFFVLFLKVDIRKCWIAILSIRIEYLLMAIALSIFANVILVSDRWRRVLGLLGCSLPFKKAIFIVISCKPIKFLLPLRLGNLFKIAYIRRYLQFGRGLSSILFDNILDKTGILFLLCMGMVFGKTHFRLEIFLILFMVGMGLIFGSEAVLSTFWRCLYKKQSKLYDFLRQTLSSFKEIPISNRFKLLSYSTFIRIFSLFSSYLLFKGFGLEIPIYKIFAFIPIVLILSEIPITLSGLGIREASVVFLFLGCGSKEEVLSVGIMLSFVERIFPAIIGLFFLRPFMKDLWRKA